MENTTHNTITHKSKVTREDRWKLNRHRSSLVWITGLPGSGKSTIAHELEHRLMQEGVRTFVLDGDNVRQGLCRDLGFSASDRKENLRRIGEVGKLFADAGILTIAAFASPYRADRLMVRRMFGEGDYIEVYLKCRLEVCESRDPKGMYRKARCGEIQNFTGVSDPYEPPENPEILLETDTLSVGESVARILHFLQEKELIR
ncbi:MAG: adenylyl-sulfate kinase [Nitrospirota bacterium]